VSVAESGRWTALDAPTAEVLLDQTHTARPGALSTSTHLRRPQPPSSGPLPTMPRRSPALVALPVAALAGLVVLGVAVVLPWSDAGGGPALGIAGIAALAVIAGLAVAVVVDLVTGRLRTTGLVALPAVAALAALTAAVVAGAAAGTGPVAQLALPPGVGGPGPQVLVVGLVVTAVAGALAVVGFVRDWGADPPVPAARSPRRAGIVATAVVGAIVLLGVTAAVLTSAATSPGRADGDPATFVGGTGALSGSLPATPAVPPTGAPCPAVAASTMPETATALLVGRSSSVAVTVCRGTSGHLYYFGANPSTRVTVTLPAVRAGSAWTASDAGLTYVVDPAHVAVQRGGAPVADEPLTGGW
jgi:hypothetical protein